MPYTPQPEYTLEEQKWRSALHITRDHADIAMLVASQVSKHPELVKPGMDTKAVQELATRSHHLFSQAELFYTLGLTSPDRVANYVQPRGNDGTDKLLDGISQVGNLTGSAVTTIAEDTAKLKDSINWEALQKHGFGHIEPSVFTDTLTSIVNTNSLTQTQAFTQNLEALQTRGQQRG